MLGSLGGVLARGLLLAELFAAAELGLGGLLEREGALRDLAGGFVGGHHDARAGNLAVDELQRDRRGALAEQALPGAEDDREAPYPELVDQAVPELPPRRRGGFPKDGGRPESLPSSIDAKRRFPSDLRQRHQERRSGPVLVDAEENEYERDNQHRAAD